MDFVVASEGEWPQWIPIILDRLGSRKIICLYGELGAGKTTFIKHLGAYLQVEDEITSPTFAIVNQYKTLAGDLMHHMDLYRLKSFDEALQVGLEEYLDGDYLTIIEWPELIEPLIGGLDALVMKMEVLKGHARKIVLL